MVKTNKHKKNLHDKHTGFYISVKPINSVKPLFLFYFFKINIRYFTVVFTT
jgi:hypothetical protein